MIFGTASADMYNSNVILFGHFLFEEKPNSTFEVIDGQQRLASGYKQKASRRAGQVITIFAQDKRDMA